MDTNHKRSSKRKRCNCNRSCVIDPENPEQNDPHSGYCDWTNELAENALDVYCRVADSDLWDTENPDDVEFTDYGPFDIEVRTLTSIVVSPPATRVKIDTQKQFTDVALDQTGTGLDTQPEFTWSTSSEYGEITQQGLFMAGSVEETCTVTATGGEVSNLANESVMERLAVINRKFSFCYGFGF